MKFIFALFVVLVFSSLLGCYFGEIQTIERMSEENRDFLYPIAPCTLYDSTGITVGYLDENYIFHPAKVFKPR